MDNKKLLGINQFISNAYDCNSFMDFLKLSVMKLHEFVMYDSGMFFCAISKDCSYFKPYIGGPIEDHYKKEIFNDQQTYLEESVNSGLGKEAYVYKALDYMHGMIQISKEPRSHFLAAQEDFHIACIRIVYKGQFMGEIYLHRHKTKPDYDDEDLFTLRILQPHISNVFNIIHTITAIQHIENSNSHQGYALGMCVFDNDISFIGGNVTGIEMLKTITVFGSSVLYHIKEHINDIKDGEKGRSSKNASVHIRMLKTVKDELEIQIYCSNSKGRDKIQYIVILQYSNEMNILSDYRFKFTKREADIIDGLIQGKNNAQIAESLNISENTIKTHIKSIYKKTGANNRAELTYVLMLNAN